MNVSANKLKPASELLIDPRWTALVSRDPNADGPFYYAVKTTGVYCRPSCLARLDNPENVRFYENSDRILGMTPLKYRPGDADTEIRFAIGKCSLGSILVAVSPAGVCAISLGDDTGILACSLQDRFPQAKPIGGDSEFEQLVANVIGFVEAPASGLKLPLDVRGTAFQQRVWQALREIPAGATVSYTDIALRIGSPKSARAVASACARNILAVAIPCHRVVRNDGTLSGYRWGVERKAELLRRESETKKSGTVTTQPGFLASHRLGT